MKNTVLTYLNRTEQRAGNKTAIIDRERTLTFTELDRAAKRLACVIGERTRESRQPIAVLIPKGLESIVAFLGILYSGNFYAPLDENMPLPRLKTILDNLRPTCIISSTAYRATLMTVGVPAEHIVQVNVAFDELRDLNDAELLDRISHVIDTDPVYAIYTSGSTGVPKGVVVAHRGVIDYIDWAIERFHINEQTVIGNQSPFYFDNSTLDIYLCLATGATLVIIPKSLFSFPVRLMEYVREMQINFVFWVPSVLIAVANLKILEKRRRRHCSEFFSRVK